MHITRPHELPWDDGDCYLMYEGIKAVILLALSTQRLEVRTAWDWN